MVKNSSEKRKKLREKMIGFGPMLRQNIKRRATDGFAFGYNIVFPILIIFLLGILCRNGFHSEITSYQYYIVVSIPFCASMAIITAVYSGKDDAFAKTAQRVLVSPVYVESIVFSKIISCTLVFSFCNIFVLLTTSVIWKLEILKYLMSLIILFMSMSFLISAMGTFIGLGMKNFMVIKNIITVPIGVFAIAAGTFFPIGTSNDKLKIIINMSPLTWINRGIFLTLYDNSTAMLWCVIAFSIIVGVIFTKISIVTFNKEEYIYGDLPSYEK